MRTAGCNFVWSSSTSRTIRISIFRTASSIPPRSAESSPPKPYGNRPPRPDSTRSEIYLLMRRPRWKRCRAVRTVQPGTLCVVSETGFTVLELLYALLAEHIDGRNSPEGVISPELPEKRRPLMSLSVWRNSKRTVSSRRPGDAPTPGALLQIHKEGDVLIVVTDDYLREELREIASRQA